MAVCLLAGFTALISQNNLVKLEIEVCIDGKSLLCLQDKKIWWAHISYHGPGTHKDCETTISVNGKAWGKHWERPFDSNFSLDNDSLLYVESLSPYNACIRVRPGDANKWKTVIELDDEKTNGPHTYRLVLVFKNSSPKRNQKTQEPTENKRDLLQDCVEEKKPLKTTAAIPKKEPAKAAELNLEKDQAFIFKNVYFESNKTVLLPESYAELDRVAERLITTESRFVISGHTDHSGDATKNLKLSEERAKAVYDYFIKKGIEAKRMTYAGRGSTEPIDKNETEEGKKNNRRVELQIIE